MRRWWKGFRTDAAGQDLAEYALLVVLIAIVVAAILPGVGTAIATMFTSIRDWLASLVT
jgi:Flp pilus assembly pilin Flp